MRPSRVLAIMLILTMVMPLLLVIAPSPSIKEDLRDGTRGIEPGTIIGDDISTDTVWTLSGSTYSSPYRIKTNITLLPDVHLTIEPGVDVILGKGVTFYIGGTLKAIGDTFNTIYFKPDSETPGSRDWEGIEFLPTSKDSVLDHVEISFASRGINIGNGTSPTIVNSIVAYSYYFAISTGNLSTPLIKNNHINNSFYTGILIDNGSAPLVIDNRINTCLYGIIAYSGGLVQDNLIELNAVGILVWNSSAHIKNNTISHNFDGIFVFFSDPLVENNVIVSNDGNGTRFISSNSTVRNNTLKFNDVGFDIPYDSKNIIANMSGNTVNGIKARNLYYVGLKDAVIEDLYIDSGHGSGYYGLLTNQGSITLYDSENVTIRNCTVRNNMNGIYAYNSTFEVYNSYFDNSRHADINLAETSTARTYNGSVAETRVIAGDGSYLVSYGNIKVQVRNYTHHPVEDAVVEVRELTFLLKNSTTNDTGITPNLLVKKTRVSTSGLINYTLNIEVWSPGLTFNENPRSVQMDNALLITFTDLGDIIAPEMSSSGIENGQQDIDINASIIISFSEPMNRTSVEDAFSISGNVSGTFSWDGNDLIFRPDQPFEHLTYYTVIITTDARDIQGNHIKEGLAFSFTTEPVRNVLAGSSMLIGIIIVVAVIGIVTFLILKRK